VLDFKERMTMKEEEAMELQNKVNGIMKELGKERNVR
jgi:hypothetical protein